MEVIDNFYNCTNIYYSLLIYCDEKPDNLIKELETQDFPILVLDNLYMFDYHELHNRMFCMHVSKLNDLLFFKQNDISQFTVIFCYDDLSYEKVLKIIKTKKPSCEENIVITKIFF